MIGLLDVDNIGRKAKFPNFALMKLSTYYKQLDEIEWWQADHEYDKVFFSKVFDFTIDAPAITNAKEVVYGGIAYGLDNKLPDEIEHSFPDYSLYGITDTAYGFLTRGCLRNCSFCNVSDHQGLISHIVADLSEFWNGQKRIKLLDPNTFACKDWKIVTDQLINSKAKIDFTEGVDIRLMDNEKVQAINDMNVEMLHFAWDNYEFNTYEKLKKFRKMFRYRGRNMRVYVLTNYNTTYDQDMERIVKLRDLDYDPYMMIFNKSSAPKPIIELQRWVNRKDEWRKYNTFAQYKAEKNQKAKKIKGQQSLF